MDIFRSMIITSCFLGIVIAVMDILYPSEKMKKQVKIVFSLVFLLSIVTPIAKGEISFASVGDISSAYESFSDSEADVYDYFIGSVEKNICTSISSMLMENSISVAEIKTSINISDNNSISINEIEIILLDENQTREAISLINSELGDDVNVTVKEYVNENAVNDR